jgi:predicted nucleic acid-binding protein
MAEYVKAQVARTKISSKHQVTIAKGPFVEAGFREGQELTVRAVGPGRVELTSLDALFEKYRRVGLALLDTSTVIGYLDPDDRLHAGAVAELETVMRAGTGLAVSAITWTELLHGVLMGHHDEGDLQEFAAAFNVEVLAADVGVATRAAELRARLKTPDALILATADVEPEVETVICGDERWSTVPGIRPDVRLIRE